MQDFQWNNPTKLIFGKKMARRIGKELKFDGKKNILLVAGKGSIKTNGIYEEVSQALKVEGIHWIEVWGVSPNPVLSKVRDIIQIAKKENIDAIVAVGGGSVIDTAKSVAAGTMMDEDIWTAFETRELVKKALPVYTVLTLSATGSEMNPLSVITNEKEKKKWTIKGPALYPKASIIDPSYQFSLPWEQTVNGALDAMSHTMEQYFMGGASYLTLSLNESIMRTIIEMVDKLQQHPNNYDYRANLAWAATLAINGLTGAGQGGGDWGTHAIEHVISALYPEIAHGTGLGILFPAWIEHGYKDNPDIFERWAKNVWGCKSVKDALFKMRQKLEVWKAPTKLSAVGVKKDDFDYIISKFMELGHFGAVKKLNEADVMNVLTIAF